MKTQFTPGPYTILDEHDDQEFIAGTVQIIQDSDAQGYLPIALVYTVDAFEPHDYSDERDVQATECRANARLFKYAPDMFYALDFLAEQMTDDDAGRIGFREDMMEIRKLLARITTDE